MTIKELIEFYKKMSINYFQLINKYFSPSSVAYRIYLIHVTLVSNKALRIARKLKLSPAEQEFVERSAMLHDIGICKVNCPKLGCFGNLPYIQHGLEGQKILIAEGLPKEGRVCACHLGVGIYKEDVQKQKLALPGEDMYPKTLEEKIITYSDLFFSKNPALLWQERTYPEAYAKLKQYNPARLSVLEEWYSKFG